MVTDADQELEVPEVPDNEVEEEQLTEVELEAEATEEDRGGAENPGNVERITETVSFSWGGVKSCDRTDVIARNVRAGIDNWVAKKLFENKHHKYLNHGNEPYVVRTRKRKAIDGKRSCRSWVNVPCWIRFETA